jgi:predicted aldo/keto reductase-like oxidoreductase
MFPINPAFDALPGETGADDLGKLWDRAYERQPDPALDGILPERRQLYSECASRGVGLVAMKPFAAGWLFSPDLATGFTPHNLLHYALSQPGVSCVVAGAANLDQLDADVGYFRAAKVEKDYSAALAGSRWNYMGTCMYCNHCQPCTAGIDISAVNQLLHLANGGNLAAAREGYARLEVKASECQACGECLERCPFGVAVVEKMQEAVGMFE